jgi:hypothetical protein
MSFESSSRIERATWYSGSPNSTTNWIVYTRCGSVIAQVILVQPPSFGGVPHMLLVGHRHHITYNLPPHDAAARSREIQTQLETLVEAGKATEETSKCPPTAPLRRARRPRHHRNRRQHRVSVDPRQGSAPGLLLYVSAPVRQRTQGRKARH